MVPDEEGPGLRAGRDRNISGYVLIENFTADISVSGETAGEASRLGEDMKHDPYYKYLVAVIIVGVLIALFDPTPTDAIGPATVATIAAGN